MNQYTERAKSVSSADGKVIGSRQYPREGAGCSESGITPSLPLPPHMRAVPDNPQSPFLTPVTGAAARAPVVAESALTRVPLGDLRCRYGLATTSLRFSQEAKGRIAALLELEQIRAELRRRGYTEVPA